MTVKITTIVNVLEANDRIARENREIFRRLGIRALNLMSAPGAGKTTLLERTLAGLKDELRIGVVEGDIATDADARRISAWGIPVVQINTGGGCHLDAVMVRQGMEELPLEELDLVVIENVGNLVCPAEFDVGEDGKVMMLSVTEGDDKPLKYPLMFHEATLLILNKIDLLPHVEFDLGKARQDAASLNPDLEIMEVSCRTGDGLPQWFDWIRGKIPIQIDRRSRAGG